MQIAYQGSREIDPEGVSKGIETLKKSLINQGISIEEAAAASMASVRSIILPSRSLKDIVKTIEARLSSIISLPKLVFVVVPPKDTNIYNAVKIVGDTKLGFHTVCILYGNVKDIKIQLAANIGLKVNLKLGGVNHSLGSNIEIFQGGKTMCVGYDVIRE